MFKKILIANRGEIAVRVIRACRELEVTPVTVYSEADVDSLHVKSVDEHYCIGPAPSTKSYMNTEKIFQVAEQADVEAVHPGYGFLAQDHAFAEQCESRRLEFIGPSSRTLKLMGSKISARKTMVAAGVPVIPGSVEPVKSEGEASEVAGKVGYPVMVKAVAGGGGKGIRIARSREEIPQAMELASLEAEASLGSSEVYVEKLMRGARHVEFQILADKAGNVIHLGERECSLQRRYQKLVEETPSPMMTPALRKAMGETAVKAAEAAEYLGAGTVEFLVLKKQFFFLEMNTRLQVEHLITEMVTGVDIVKEQIRIAAGEQLKLRQKDVELRGHSLNCRINSEDPYRSFTPAPGTVTRYHPPGGPGVRVDSALYTGYTVPVFYDSLIAKLAVHGGSRLEAIMRMKNALDEYVIEGIETTIPFHKKILDEPEFRDGNIHTSFVEEKIGGLIAKLRERDEEVAALSAVLIQHLNRRTIRLRSEKAASAWKTVGRRRMLESQP